MADSDRRLALRRRLPVRPAVRVPQHVDEHSPKDAIFLAVDQELGEGP